MNGFIEFLVTPGDRKQTRSLYSTSDEKGYPGFGGKRPGLEFKVSISSHASWAKLLIPMNSNCFNCQVRIMAAAYFARLLESSSLAMTVKVFHKKSHLHIFEMICVILLSSSLLVLMSILNVYKNHLENLLKCRF